MWHPGVENAELMTDMVNRYGTRITPYEMEVFLNDNWTSLITDIETVIQRESIFSNAGIYSFLDWWVARQLLYNDMTNEIQNIIWMTNNNEYLFRLFAILGIEDSWDRARVSLERYAFMDFTIWQLQLLKDIQVADDVIEFINGYLINVLLDADTHIQNNSFFKEYGITSFAQFRYFSGNISSNPSVSRDIRIMNNILSGVDSNFIILKINELESLLFSYNGFQNQELFSHYISMREEFFSGNILNYRGQQRILDILTNYEYLSIMDGNAFINTVNYFVRVFLLKLLIINVLILPFLTYDNIRNLTALQYSTKIGRQLVFRKLVAVVISSILVSTIVIIVFSAIYSITGILMYWNHPLVSFANLGISNFPAVHLFSFTFGSYFVLLSAITYVIAIGTGLIAFVISHFSQSFVGVIVKGVPALFTTYILVANIFDNAFSVQGRLYSYTNILGVELIITFAFFVLALLIAVYVAKREKTLNILD